MLQCNITGAPEGQLTLNTNEQGFLIGDDMKFIHFLWIETNISYRIKFLPDVIPFCLCRQRASGRASASLAWQGGRATMTAGLQYA
jgi:hypothetical protein